MVDSKIAEKRGQLRPDDLKTLEDFEKIFVRRLAAMILIAGKNKELTLDNMSDFPGLPREMALEARATFLAFDEEQRFRLFARAKGMVAEIERKKLAKFLFRD